MTVIEMLKFMYPQDKANHYMRGALVAAVGAVAVYAIVTLVPALAAQRRLALPLAIVGAVVAAYAAGRYKEWADARANAAARALWLSTDQSAPFVPPHGVETADWQFTAWGATPVVLVLAAQVAIDLLQGVLR